MAEEQPIGAVVGTFPAVDDETPALVYRLEPESPYFEVDSGIFIDVFFVLTLK